jgi:hypothetical protein
MVGRSIALILEKASTHTLSAFEVSAQWSLRSGVWARWDCDDVGKGSASGRSGGSAGSGFRRGKWRP